ncbi:hypothetical protein TRFO_13189 [Tritrichomonas foetus]|uniref:Uncharacterized protein n=1 Tax=Tritrichomonas foetus TaxID=1144522 RepID=A0A1J4L366_9EUKA|nr:hypothetical protein TRFO_13189 [Tritrichomonas foetus]|eukprot:OHT16357.1 hypothetical protein TRFO_13189 [Tritrichomonas foetus]
MSHMNTRSKAKIPVNLNNGDDKLMKPLFGTIYATEEGWRIGGEGILAKMDKNAWYKLSGTPKLSDFGVFSNGRYRTFNPNDPEHIRIVNQSLNATNKTNYNSIYNMLNRNGFFKLNPSGANGGGGLNFSGANTGGGFNPSGANTGGGGDVASQVNANAAPNQPPPYADPNNVHKTVVNEASKAGVETKQVPNPPQFNDSKDSSNDEKKDFPKAGTSELFTQMTGSQPSPDTDTTHGDISMPGNNNIPNYVDADDIQAATAQELADNNIHLYKSMKKGNYDFEKWKEHDKGLYDLINYSINGLRRKAGIPLDKQEEYTEYLRDTATDVLKMREAARIMSADAKWAAPPTHARSLKELNSSHFGRMKERTEERILTSPLDAFNMVLQAWKFGKQVIYNPKILSYEGALKYANTIKDCHLNLLHTFLQFLQSIHEFLHHF